jgi:translocation and assembly module TamA
VHPVAILIRVLHRWPSALAIAVAALISTNIEAADAPASATSEPAAPATSAAAEPVYHVVVDAPPALKAAIERSIGLTRWQTFADMTPELLDRLANEARDQATNAAAAEGYFSAGAEVAIDRSVKPPTVTLTLTPGEPTRVSSVRIDVTGPATTDDALGAAAVSRIRDEWGLPTGDIFRQTAWSTAKENALATLRNSPYAAAKIVKSEALIDPDARSAELSIELESGPAYRFGSLLIQGLEKYQAAVVSNYNTIQPGELYTNAAVEQLVRRLNATGYFSSVQATIDTSTSPDSATIRIAVIEAPTRTFEGGIGYSTDVRFSVKANYRDVNVDSRATQMLAQLQYDSSIQSGSLRFVQPANENHWITSLSLGVNRTDIENLVTQTAFAGVQWRTVEERRERVLSATYYLDEQQPADAPSERSHAFYVEGEQFFREVDNLVAPTKGWIGSAQLGGGIPGVSTRGFGRVIGRYAAWVPLNHMNTLTFRAEAGAVLSPTRDGIPSTLLFRTGGDTTVRGYAFESLGVHQGNAIVGGRYYAIGSAEAIHWINEAWGLAAFVDTGNASDSIPDFRFDVGYGAGVRIRTPLGPFRLDVAYGQQVHQFRLHFSVGLSF